MGRAHVAADRITGLEIEFANLRGRDVNVVRSGQIVVVRGTEEAVAVGENFKDASAKMCPSFSLCAWRILKMRSCLRRPLVPGISRERAMRLNSVMFFSLSSAMVMFTCVKVGCVGWDTEGEVLRRRRYDRH